ncbi:MAG: SDR family NAD(P)-dependent oxidoreductase [Rhizobiaceae bacterium]
MRALITGAAHGLGRALTQELLNNGHEVIAVDIDTDALDELAVSSRGACLVRMADMANPDSIERMLASISGKPLDLVILNAGISATGRFEDIPSSAYANLVAINLAAPIIMASSLVRGGHMAKKSKLVFISSLSHVTGYPGAAVYGATKDALAVYAKSIRKAFKKRGVGVLTVYPGPIRTDHAEKHAPKGAKASKRMLPEMLAKKILKAAKGKSKELYPGGAAETARLLGKIAPNLATRMMRRAIFDKLDGPQY